MPKYNVNEKEGRLPENCKTPQNAYSYEKPMCYRIFHTPMYERKPMNERKIQQKIQNSDRVSSIYYKVVDKFSRKTLSLFERTNSPSDFGMT